MEITREGKKLKILKGNIVKQADCEAIVNAANAQLRSGGGVAGAIHRSAGPGLEEEAVPLGPIQPGQAVITSGHNLPNKYVIHCLGPVYGRDKPEEKILSDCYKNALLLADKHKIKCIAFPAISTGIFGYPIEEAAGVTVRTILRELKNLNYVNEIRIVLFSDEDFIAFEHSLKREIK